MNPDSGDLAEALEGGHGTPPVRAAGVAFLANPEASCITGPFSTWAAGTGRSKPSHSRKDPRTEGWPTGASLRLRNWAEPVLRQQEGVRERRLDAFHLRTVCLALEITLLEPVGWWEAAAGGAAQREVR